MTERLPGGLWPVMLTPFSHNGEIDLKSLEELIDFYLDTGASGLFANCLSSEMFQLTDNERILVAEMTVRRVNGNIPVVATGNFGEGLTRNLDFIRRIGETGVDAVVINTNQVVAADASEAEFREALDAFIQATGAMPLGIYECPVPYKRLVSKDVIRWLGESGKVLFHKDTTCNSEQLRQKITASRGTLLGVYNANMATALQSLRDGVQGLTPTGANYFPELYDYMIKNHEDDHLLLQKVNNFLTVADALIDGKHYPLLAKIFLAKRGLHMEPLCRLPVPVIEPQILLQLDRLMSGFTELTEEIKFNAEYRQP